MKKSINLLGGAALVDTNSVVTKVNQHWYDVPLSTLFSYISTKLANSANTLASLIVTGNTTVGGTLAINGGVIVDKGTVTQAGAITTAVTLNKPAGVITTVASTLGAGINAAFTVNNSFCLATSVIQLCEDDVLTSGWAKANVQNITAGAFDINITNIHPINSFNNVINIHFIIV